MDTLSVRFIFSIFQVSSIPCQDTHALLFDLWRTSLGGRLVFFYALHGHLNYGVSSEEAHLAKSFGKVIRCLAPAFSAGTMFAICYITSPQNTYQIINTTLIAVATETLGSTEFSMTRTCLVTIR
jgi:hypothetical protein